jgi:hypothetical protein
MDLKRLAARSIDPDLHVRGASAKAAASEQILL